MIACDGLGEEDADLCIVGEEGAPLGRDAEDETWLQAEC